MIPIFSLIVWTVLAGCCASIAWVLVRSAGR